MIVIDEELIRIVAEKVMGWKLKDEYYYLPEETDFYKPIYYVGEFDPVTNLNHAFMVVERMRELGYWSRIDIMQNITEVEFYQPKGIADCESEYEICHAICMAAVKAVRHG